MATMKKYNISANLIRVMQHFYSKTTTAVFFNDSIEYRTISLISHSRRVMLKIKLNRTKPLVKKISAEEQAGFRARESTTEQNFKLRILSDKYLQHQQDRYHVFTDFKNAFQKGFAAALWATMKKYNISTSRIRVIKHFYGKATSAVLLNNTIGYWFRSTVGI